jgi:hypothetical protein
MIPYYQLSLVDIFSDFQEIYESNKSQFLSLLQQNINLDEIVPASLKAFLCINGQNPKIPFECLFVGTHHPADFSILADPLLLIFLCYSRHHREFCSFDKVSNTSKITRFKQDFLEDIQAVFERLVDLTEPICHAIDSCKANMTIFDSSGIEAWQKLCISMTVTALIKLLIAPCLPIPPPTPTLNSSILTAISAIPITLASSPMVWGLSAISVFIIGTFLINIPKSFSKRNRTLQMRINPFMTQSCLSLLSRIFFASQSTNLFR